MGTDPKRFVAHYESEECDSAYEMWNFHAPSLTLPCDECNELHTFYFKYLEHTVVEWDRIEWEEGVSFPDETLD